jgi:hypothetical protein
MSVTFHSELDTPTGFRVGCSCESNQGPVFGTYADAEEFYVRHDLLNRAIPEVLVGCEYAGREGFCDMGHCFITAVYPERGPELNVSNDNAILILSTLGLRPRVVDGPFGPLPEDACGSMDAEEFLGRVLAAEIMSVGDPGTETETFIEEGCATLIACGRPEGYTDARLAQLREVAEFARAHGKEVVWS